MRLLLYALLLIAIFRVLTIPKLYSDGQKIRISSFITSEVRTVADRQQFNLTNLLITVSPEPELSYGDWVVVEGRVKDKFLEEAKIVEFSKNDDFLFKVRNKLLSIYRHSFGPPDSALLAGVAIGSKELIDKDTSLLLRNTGTSHVVVASGMNVSLVASFVLGVFLTFLNRRLALVFSLIFIWVYSLISGFGAPIVRASLMSSVALVTQLFGYLSYTWYAFLLSVLSMLVLKPQWFYDIGFILSFGATLSLMLFQPLISRKVHFVPSIFRESFSTSVSAQIIVAPIIFFTFGQFNIFSPFINALVLWTIPFITIIAMIGGIVGLFVEIPGQLILLLAYPLTRFFFTVVELGGRL